MRISLLILVFFQILLNNADASIPVVTVKKSSALIVVDALKNELAWQGATSLNLTKKFKNETPTATVDVKMLYDDNSIYFYFRVTDDYVNYLATQGWMGDKIELYFGLPGYSRGVSLLSEKNARQFTFDADQDWVDDETKTCYFTRNDITDWEGINIKNADGCKYAFKETNTGYDFEVSIQKKALQNINFSTIESIGFDISLVDYDAEDDLEIGDFWRNRYVWYNDGKLEFATENWSALDLGLMKFEKTTALHSQNYDSHFSVSNKTISFTGSVLPLAIEVLNMQGQQIALISSVSSQNYLQSISSGAYIFKLHYLNKVIITKALL